MSSQECAQVRGVRWPDALEQSVPAPRRTPSRPASRGRAGRRGRCHAARHPAAHRTGVAGGQADERGLRRRRRQRRRRQRQSVRLGAPHLRHRPATPAPGAHAAARPGQPGQRRLGLAGGRRRTDPDELPRGQPGRAGAAALPAQFPDGRRRHRCVATGGVRRRARSRAGAHGQAAGRCRVARRVRVPAGHDRAGAGRAHLLAGQSAGHRLRRRRGHVQRARRAQLPAADPVLGLAEPRHERRPGAGRQGPHRRRQRRHAARRPADQLPGAGRVRAGTDRTRREGEADHRAGGGRDGAPAARAPTAAHHALRRVAVARDQARALQRAGAAGGLHALLGLVESVGVQGLVVRALGLSDGHRDLHRRVAAHRRPLGAPRGLRRQQARRAAFRAGGRPEFSQRGHGPAYARPDRAEVQEDFVESGGLPMRTVMCLRAYRHLPGLYDVAVLSQSVDARTEGVQGRFDARGVSFQNAMLLASHYLQGFAWKRSP